MLDDGTIGAGFDLTSFTADAQVNIIEQNPYDYMFKLQSHGQADDYLTVHNDGYVGIGYANSGNATLQVVTPASATGNASVLITGDAPNDRYMFIGDGTNPASAAAFLSVKNTGVGIGIDDLSGGAKLAVRGSSNTILDLFETSSTPTNNAQIRFIDDDGSTVRHKITEDASGNLLIDPAVSAGNNKVKIDGNEDVTGNLVVTGATNLGSTLDVSGVAAFATKVRIGTRAPSTGYTGYMLGVDGDIVATKVIVQTGSWADKVFAPGYNLRSLTDVENYINQNQHLPEIPSEQEVLKNGTDVGEMNKLLLQKVEELTLYVIALQKQVDSITKQ